MPHFYLKNNNRLGSINKCVNKNFLPIDILQADEGSDNTNVENVAGDPLPHVMSVSIDSLPHVMSISIDPLPHVMSVSGDNGMYIISAGVIMQHC